MDTLITANAAIAGFFACAAIHYAVHWWLSRHERVHLVFSVQCAAFTVLCLAFTSFFRAKTIPDAQVALDGVITIGVIIHAVFLQLYVDLGGRRDRAFRALVTGALAVLGLLNQWAPLRGIVLELRTMPLPWGGTGLLAIRTPPGASLAVLYLFVVAIQGYGLFVARAIWKRDRAGAILVAIGAAAVLTGVAIAILVDLAKVRAPYPGALPNVIFVLSIAFFLSREYSARGAQLRAHRERLEELVAMRTRELSTAKDEAERANQAKSQFLAHISHEIRNPLHIILGYAQILERDPTLGGVHRTKVGIMRSSGNLLLKLMNDVLEMARIEARHPELVEELFDLWATLDEVQRMFAGEAAAKGIEVKIECAPELPRAILGDGAKVKQIVINLASNALKFTERGSIRLDASASVSADGAILAKIVVADTGIGMAAQDTARIFQPFEQLDAGKRAGGTGLGLAISLGHARLMGGDLAVESAPGMGSRFTFTFAAKSLDLAATPAAAEAIAPVAAGKARFKVLIVDDVADNRDVLSELLAARHFETRTAADGPGAISIHADWRPDLVLMDLRMPGMGGLEAIRRLREAGSRAAIGALSASVLADDEHQALALGADFFLGKPYDDRELMNRIARALGTAPGAGTVGLGEESARL